MHLKSLTLKGFKSFADRVAMRLEPGVAVIVGPNGSGKSNVTDAVLWVLGEQSAKTLRGNAMEDVIFAGSSGRQAVGVAEVDLVLDNTDGSLPLEFAEVTVTRRMYRSGESEYLINGSPCRLMDVHDLLHDTGLGRDTHSVISQGRLDEILSLRAEDRRMLIEEAAGVLKHKKRLERALRKLSGLDGNLERAKDVLDEVERQLRPLRRQADRAREYEDLSAQLRDMEVAVAVADLRQLQSQWDVLEKQERERDSELELARYRLAEKERELGTFQSLLEEKGLFVGDLSEQRQRLQAVLERLNSGLLLLEEKGKNLVERLSELRSKVHQSESRRVRRQEELTQLTEHRTGSEAEMKALYTRLGELRREAEAARKDRQAAEDALTAVNQAARRARKEVDDARADAAAVEQALAAFVLEDELVAARIGTLGEQSSTLHATLSARRARLGKIEQDLTRTTKELALADSEVEKHVRLTEARRKALEEMREALAGVRAQLRGLEEVDKAFQTATPALAWALSSEQRIPGLIGPVTESIRVTSEMERVVEQALGADLFCVLVRETQGAKTLLRLLEDRGAGDISVLSLDAAIAPRVAEGVHPGTRVVDSIECDDEVRPAVESLIGDVWYVPTLAEALDAAERAPGPRYVTADGHMVWPSGKLTVGPVIDASASVLARKRRMNALRDDESAALARTGDSEAAMTEAEEALAQAQQDALELGQRIASLTGDRGAVSEEIGRLEQALTDLVAESDTLAARRTAIADKHAKDLAARDAMRGKITDGEARIEQAEDEAATKREERDNKFRDEAAIANRLSQCQVDIATVSEREIHMKRQLAGVTADLAEIEATLNASQETERALELLRERVQPVHDLYSALLEKAEFWAVKLRDRARFEQADSESLREAIHSAQDAVRDSQTAVQDITAAMGDVRVELGQLQVHVDAAVSRIVDDFGMPIERALEIPPADDRDKTADRAMRMRRQMANMGPVNAVAVEEHRALDERRAFLASQIDDLSSSRNALHKVVRAIDRKTRDLFLETFEQVNGHFQDVFAVLFPGGHAELRLTDPDDPEQTGVEVIAQPLGKRLQKMTLMSGGEKSLTALALLFALYHTRPAPFYVLDEVEAALDDSNLRRFVSFVDSLRRHTQFIIVTHQRRTMEMADVLYGVSMQSDGVSKVLSQRLDRSAAPVESPA